MLLRATPLAFLSVFLLANASRAQQSTGSEAADAQKNAGVILVCPTQFTETIQPWIKRREAEGLDVVTIPSNASADKLQQSIQAVATKQSRFVVLVGDAPAIGTRCQAQSQVPTNYRSTVVTAKWGSTPTLATDLLYGDTNGDGIPEMSVGRLPVDTPGDLAKLLDRIVAYETSQNFGPWRNRVQLVGGVGGFGAFADSAIETVTRTVVTNVLPPETQTSVAYASAGHPFFPKGDSFTDAITNQYQVGCRFWVYAGHGSVTELDRYPRSAAGVPILDKRTLKKLSATPDSPPIAMMLCCYTGAFDASEDSFAEDLLLHQGGPIAVISGSRVTMPYGNATATVGLIEGVYKQRLDRLGDAWLASLKQILGDKKPDAGSVRVMIDGLATMVSPAGTKLIDERTEHAQLFNLLGDPTLRLSPPQRITIKAETGYNAGQPITFDVTSPISGSLTVSCHHPLGSAKADDPNETEFVSQSLELAADTTTSVSITVPPEISGPVIIRTHQAGKNAWATAAVQTNVRK